MVTVVAVMVLAVAVMVLTVALYRAGPGAGINRYRAGINQPLPHRATALSVKCFALPCRCVNSRVIGDHLTHFNFNS